MIDPHKISWTFLIIMLGLFAIPILLAYFSRSARVARKLKKVEQKQLDELYENKCEGPHKWFDMPINGEKTYVCQECCWCPSKETFVKPHFVRAELKAIEFEEELKKYFEEKVSEIAEEQGLDKDFLLNLNERIASIKKDFTLQWLEKSIMEGLDDL